MEKPVAAIEFGSKKMKIVVGYELENQVCVLYASTRPYGHMIENGEILDPSRLAQALKEVKNFSDPAAQLKLNIQEVTLALPPYGLMIYTSQQFSAVGGEDGSITKIDIRNIHNLIKSGTLPQGNSLVDIVPVFYELDQGRRFLLPPIGQKSLTLRVSVMVHSLPTRVVNTYTQPVRDAQVALKRSIVAPYGAAALLASYPDMPRNYLLVDIGAEMTTVSLIGDQRLYASNYFNWGGDKITERIITTFNINENDAEKYKITYGIDNRVMNFNAPVCKSSDGEGNEIKHYSSELNEIIKGELAVFTKDLNASIDELLKDYDKSTKNLPMILIGGGAKLNGLVDYLAPKVQSDSVTVVTPRNLGARDATYTNCLGLILASKASQTSYEENQAHVGQVTRDEK